VYVYTGNNYNWTLAISDGASDDQFGAGVAVSRDTLVVGATPELSSGSVYIYKRTFTTGGASTWKEQDKLTAGDVENNFDAFAAFGNAVALSENELILVVGSYLDNDQGTDSGSVYVFARSSENDSFVQEAKLTATDGEVEDYFGTSLDISGEIIVVGSYGHGQVNDGFGFQRGSASVFERTGIDNLWSQRAKLTASDGVYSDSDWFGRSVAISGNRIIVGAPGTTVSASKIGKAYLFEMAGDSTKWTEQAIMVASDGTAFNRFGFSVAISTSGVMVVGAHGDDSNTGVDSGSAYLFTEGTRTEDVRLTATGAAAQATYGLGVAISDIAVVIGAPQDGGNGSVYSIDLRQLVNE